MITTIISEKVPDKIQEYIKHKFGTGFRCKINDSKDPQGNIFYKTELSQDDLFYSLKFDQSGELLERKIKPVYTTHPIVHVSHPDEPFYEVEGFYEGNF